MPTRTISFDKETLNIIIHNQYPGLELTSPVYCSNGTTCHALPSQQIDTGNTMEASFGINSRYGYFNGILLYKLQRKHTTKTGNHPNNSTASIGDTATNIYLLVLCNIFNIDDYGNDYYACLLECADDFTWDEDKLWALYHQYLGRIHANYRYIVTLWLMNDGAVIKTGLDITYGSDYKFNIFISKGTGKYHMEKPMRIDLER
jgi:hypothetical protein